MADPDKQLHWAGTSLEDLTAFPADAKRIAGHQLRLVQKGEQPDHWKAIPDVGPGVVELLIDIGDAYRVFYVAKFAEGIYVLHAFNKKTRKTSQHDLDRGRRIYRDVVAERAKAASAKKNKG